MATDFNRLFSKLMRTGLTEDQIGDYGQLLAAIELSRPVHGSYHRALFRPTFLGSKYPTADFLVDLLAPDLSAIGFLFLQVKSTSQVHSRVERLRISVPASRFNRLVALPVPSYVIGVDVLREKSYVVGAYGRREKDLTSMTRRFDLNDEQIRIGLYEEALGFWKRIKGRLSSMRFANA